MLSRWFRCGLLTKKTNHMINGLGPWDSPTSSLRGEVVGWMLNPTLGPMISSARSTDGNPSESWTPELQGPFWLWTHQEGRWVDSIGEVHRSSVSWTHSDLFGCSWSVSSIVVGVLVALSCLTLCDPMDCSPLGSSVHGILQGRILEWVAIPFSMGSSWPRDWTWVSCVAGRFFTIWATRKACILYNKTAILSIALSQVLRTIQANCQT